ncbi:MAG: gluconate 2-dehydrogenase subunit 3 family protein [Gammaproteobacteria bacterium]|nr:gluconate 2-dehydrogenase subunit 3 family protein [Gammaproteobacteria bacterium]
MGHKQGRTLTRRETLAWLARAGLTLPLVPPMLSGCADDPGQTEDVSRPVPESPAGYGRDPDLLNPTVPWPLTMTRPQLDLTEKLGDLILPPDWESPAASEIGVPEFIDEWISAPYPVQTADRATILDGLERLADAGFLQASPADAGRMVDAIASGGHGGDYEFFKRFRYVAMTGYYSSDVGIRLLGFVGNVSLARFDGPPPEIRRLIGLPPGKT